MLILPVTLCAAAAAAIINLWLAIRCGQMRSQTKLVHGDDHGGPLTRRMPTEIWRHAAPPARRCCCPERGTGCRHSAAPPPQPIGPWPGFSTPISAEIATPAQMIST